MADSELFPLDFMFLAKELGARLNGGVFRKIYQPGRKRLLFEIYAPSSGTCYLFADSRRAFVTEKKEDMPDEPPDFCMFLRKHLTGSSIQEVRQHGFDRIVEIETERNILVLEFVPPGNTILCDKMYDIIMPMEVQRWKHREIRPKAGYLFPPEQGDMRKLEIWDFFTALSKSDEDVATSLSGMGLGQRYAKEACVRSKMRTDKPASKVTVDEATELFNAVKSMMASHPEPRVYKGFISPFQLYSASEPGRALPSFSAAVEELYASSTAEEEGAAAQEAAEAEAERVGRIGAAREEAKVALEERKAEKSTKAQLIYKHYDIVSNVLQGVRSARDKGMSWQQIKERALLGESRESRSIKEIRENDGVIVLGLDGNDVELDIRKTPEENAGELFDVAKRIARKIGRMERLPEPKPMSVEEIQYSLTGRELRTRPAAAKKARKSKEARAVPAPSEEPRPAGVEIIRAAKEEPKRAAADAAAEKTAKAAKPRRAARAKGRRWYESYRWFISSEGNVVVAGKNAAQNDSVIESRLKEGDTAFHADIHGAAFVVAKAGEGGKVGPLTIKEAAEFAAAHSKAWSSGFSETDVLQFGPGTLSKTTPEGRRLPRGSFYAPRPEHTHEKIEVKLSLGVAIEGLGAARVAAGPLMPVRKACKCFATIQPGGTAGDELAQRIKNALLAKCLPEHRRAIEALPLDEFARHIPSGAGSLVN